MVFNVNPYLSSTWLVEWYSPTITMLNRFYTVNGLPIDEDPEFNTNNKLDIVTIPEGTTYAEPGKRTLYMNMNREPRFYAWVAFENGYYECRTDDKRYAYHKFWGAGVLKETSG